MTKFYINVPKTTFESTIGTFTVPDFFTYIDISNKVLNKTTLTVDNKSTLPEASYSSYDDRNGLWTFLLANETINPFKLLAQNPTLYQEAIQEKVNLLLFATPGSTTGGLAFPAGSLVFPYIGNTGSSASYGYTGNFDINGPFARIEDVSFYDGNMVIGSQYGSTSGFISLGTTTDQVTVLKLNDDGSYSWGGVYYTSNKKQPTNVVVFVEDDTNGTIVFRQPETSNITVDELLDFGAVKGFTAAVTQQTIIEDTAKNIQVFVKNQISVLNSSFISAKYN